MALEQALSLDPPAAVSAEESTPGLRWPAASRELWRDPPSLETIERWAEHALAIAEAGSRAHATSMMARARVRPGAGRDLADEARALAAQTGDPALIITALQTQTDVAVAQGALEEARRLMEEGLQIVPATGDPYEREGLLLMATIVFARDGRMAEARRLAAEHDALATRLSPAPGGPRRRARPDCRDRRRGMGGRARAQCPRQGRGTRRQPGHTVPVQLADRC